MLKLSNHQQAIMDWIQSGSGNGIVGAVAGSGKTFTVVDGMSRMVGSILYVVFNKKNQVEAQAKITNPNVCVKTFNALGFGLLVSNNRGRYQVDGQKCYNITKSLLCNDKEKGILIPFVSKLVSLAKISGVGVVESKPFAELKTWTDIIEHHGLSIPDPADCGDDGDCYFREEEVIDIAKRVLTISNQSVATNLIDFDDQIYVPILNGLKAKQQFDWVIIDEAQDTSDLRREIAKLHLSPTGRFLAVGDSRQAIYGFAGADWDSMDRIQKDMSAVSLPLSTCYRCAKNIIAHAQAWNPEIQSFEGQIDGVVRDIAWEEFAKDFTSWGFSKNDAILCRKNAPLASIAFQLLRKGIPCRIEGRNVADTIKALANRWKINDLAKLRDRVSDYLAKETNRLMSKDQAHKIEALEDKCETLVALIDRCMEGGMKTKSDLFSTIDKMFGDTPVGQVPNCLVLSSVHRSKGLEWDRVFLIDRPQFMPSKAARKDWQKLQESNLIYVAITRAKKELVEVLNFPSSSTK
jgi:DNA helicase II / ATP-dependent DNA helicase PcrA